MKSCKICGADCFDNKYICERKECAEKWKTEYDKHVK